MSRLPLLLIATLLAATSVRAHVPHDVAQQLSVSPDFASDGTVLGAFALVDLRTFGRSTDGGHTWRMRALPMAQHGIKDFAWSPDAANDGTVFCATGLGLYRSSDRGLTWQRLDGGLGIPICSAVAVSPDFASDGTVLLATRSGAWRSLDGGDSWSPADTGLTESNLTFVAFGPSNGGTPVAYLGGAVVHRSASLGATWLALADLGGLIDSVALSPTFGSDNTLVAATVSQGVHASTNAGLDFSDTGPDLPAGLLTDVAFTPGGALFLTHQDGVYRAPGPFQSWTALDQGLEEPDEHGLPHFRSLAVSPDFGNDATVLLASFEGLYRSEDGGNLWEQVNTYHQTLVNRLVPAPDFASTRQVVAATPGGGTVLWTVPLDQAAAPGLRVTGAVPTGSGASGPAPSPGAGPPGPGSGGPGALGQLEVRSTGLGSLWNNGLALSPDYAADHTLFFGYVGLHRSTDRGRSWTSLTLPAGVAVVRDLALSPAFATDDTLFVGTNGVGFYRSTDRGDSWVPAQGGLPADFKTRRIAVSPAFPQDQTLVACSWNHGVWRSTDGGDSWTASATGLTGINHQTLAISPDFAVDQTLLIGAKPGRLSRSTDGGQTWQTADAGLPVGDDGLLVLSIAFSPDHARDRRVACALGDGSVWLSEDGADSWQLLATFDDGMVQDLAFSPDVAHDGLLLVAAPPLLRALRVDRRPDPAPVSPVVLRGQGVPFQVASSAGWETQASLDALAKEVEQTSFSGAWREVLFSGRRVALHAERGPDAPIIALELDGQSVGMVDLFAPQPSAPTEVFGLELSEAGIHRLRVLHTGLASGPGSAQLLRTDGFSVVP